jgi:hypothetical protein
MPESLIDKPMPFESCDQADEYGDPSGEGGEAATTGAHWPKETDTVIKTANNK